jgi:uncharacterized membrane protein YbaN (DUF454 family)
MPKFNNQETALRINIYILELGWIVCLGAALSMLAVFLGSLPEDLFPLVTYIIIFAQIFARFIAPVILRKLAQMAEARR